MAIKVVGPAKRGDALKTQSKGFKGGKGAYNLKTDVKSFGKKA